MRSDVGITGRVRVLFKLKLLGEGVGVIGVVRVLGVDRDVDNQRGGFGVGRDHARDHAVHC